MGPPFDKVQIKPGLCVAIYFYGHLHFEPPSLVEIVLAVLAVLPILFTTVIVVAPWFPDAIEIPKIVTFWDLAFGMAPRYAMGANEFKNWPDTGLSNGGKSRLFTKFKPDSEHFWKILTP